ncbi:protease modulator HflK [Altererythrobacter arenosus]|uniref:Protease modulator HflK n=1 Tax=Altererythrobacter arenosus TaxID=3032592 RepID=A0ABY8FTG3_9SPHN|nr:protease modulator HflK [Altererythrobacter sp. CAU 1644]WFL78311.1 protease modulator HflK [Altererythrobacter sp. CAU 1644]
MAGGKSPWGGGAGGGGSNGGDSGETGGDTPGEQESPSGGSGSGDGPRNPWLPGGGSGDRGKRRSASIEDIFKSRGPEGPRRRKGGGGGPNGPSFRLPQRPDGRSWTPLILAAVTAIWILTTGVHFVQPREQGIVTWLGGRYSSTLNPGTNFTLPWPFQQVTVENVSQIRSEKIPDGTQEKLILTADQNLVDLSYLIRWNISDLSLYQFQLEDPRDTLLEVGESAMRAAVAKQALDTVLTGAGRAEIEQDVRERMQARLDAYRSGIAVQGIEINKTDPPSRVEEAFKDVSSAQQDADAAMNRARAIAQQLLARAQGDATEFNNIYAEYKLAPEVTRRRLYYETMESVLSKTDKTIVEADGVTPFLPLPEVQRRTRAAREEAGGQQ